MIRRPPRSNRPDTLLPYTTLFRSCKSLIGFGTEQQKAHWLPKLAAGAIAAFGLTEPDSGSDSAAMKTRAVQSGNGYVLNGTKRYITNAPFADVILVMARTNAEALRSEERRVGKECVSTCRSRCRPHH